MLFKRVILLVVATASLTSASAMADPGGLVFLLPNLYGPGGLFVDSEADLPDGSTHSAHFNSAFQSEFTQFNIALASQVVALPLPSPASGFTYALEPGSGVFSRSTQSFGPIFAERAETIGRRRFSSGLSFQSFSFDSLEGLDLNRLPAVFTHDSAHLGGGRSDLVTTMNSIDARVDQVTAFLTYGLTDFLDISLALPWVSTHLSAESRTTVQRIGTANNPDVHFFEEEHVRFGKERRFRASGSASGIGDITLRLKGNAIRGPRTHFAAGLDVRLPTGDEEDLLGAGAFGIKPFVVMSFPHRRTSPHINLGYQWNGDSVLAGDVRSGRKESLPDRFFYTVGVDVGINPRLTLALDILGQRVIDSSQLVAETFTAADGSTFPTVSFREASFSQTDAAMGVKINPWGKLLVDLNVLLKLDDGGLRDDVTTLFGFEYGL